MFQLILVDALLSTMQSWTQISCPVGPSSYMEHMAFELCILMVTSAYFFPKTILTVQSNSAQQAVLRSACARCITMKRGSEKSHYRFKEVRSWLMGHV